MFGASHVFLVIVINMIMMMMMIMINMLLINMLMMIMIFIILRQYFGASSSPPMQSTETLVAFFVLPEQVKQLLITFFKNQNEKDVCEFDDAFALPLPTE